MTAGEVGASAGAPGAAGARDLTATVAGLAAGALRAADLADAALERIARENSSLNAFTYVARGEARAAAAAAGGRRARGVPLSPLDGVPVAVKASIAVRGWPHTAGMQRFRTRVAREDAFVIARLREQGAVFLGATNMDEAGLGATSMNPWYGTTQNPRRPGFAAGGSSGGSAAAVAAGICSLAVGSDTIGSVRIPAAYCGVSALKPTFGLVSVRGVEPAHPRFDHVGPLVASARDLAIALLAFAAFDPACPVAFPVALQPAHAPGTRRRIGYATRLAEVGCEPSVIAAFERAVARLRNAGHELIPVDVAAWEPGSVRRAIFALCEREMARHYRESLNEHPGEFSPALREWLAYGARLAPPDVARLEARIAGFFARIEQQFQSVDVLITPTTPAPAFALDGPIPANSADLTAIASVTGHPALATALSVAPDALPTGLQWIGHRGADLDLVRLATDCGDLAR